MHTLNEDWVEKNYELGSDKNTFVGDVIYLRGHDGVDEGLFPHTVIKVSQNEVTTVEMSGAKVIPYSRRRGFISTEWYVKKPTENLVLDIIKLKDSKEKYIVLELSITDDLLVSLAVIPYNKERVLRVSKVDHMDYICELGDKHYRTEILTLDPAEYKPTKKRHYQGARMRQVANPMWDTTGIKVGKVITTYIRGFKG